MEKENIAQEPKLAAAGAEARKDTAAAPNLGKFKSVDALLNAYNSLEAEFTRRSQALRELEERERAAKAAREEVRKDNGQRGREREASAVLPEVIGEEQTAANAESAVSDSELADRVRRITEAYLAEHAAMRESAPYIMAEGGSFSAAPAQRARSLEEAGKLAAELFCKNG